MLYKIAIGSSDGVNVDLSFGEVKKFLIYEVDKEITLVEERIAEENHKQSKKANTEINAVEKNTCNTEINAVEAGDKSTCNTGCGGHGNGCTGSSDVAQKVLLIEDCRCVVCKKIGFHAQKQFEKKAISVFDVECLVEEALEKITDYYGKIDHHKK